MHASIHRRLLAVLLGGAAALAGWSLVPGTPLDKAAFTGVVRGFANPPFFIAGDGGRSAPWSLRTLSSRPVTDPARAPFVISIGDDPEGVFQSSPPAPIDLAVILSNLRRLGAERVAISSVMAWQAPDAIGLLALEAELRRFGSVLTASPLTRAPEGDPLPPAFREASLPLSSLHGVAAALPVVNRLPLRGTILGGDGAKAGFTELESEPEGGRLPLLARWDDRVVLAYPLLVVLERERLPLDGVEVRLGQYLRLSADGPVVPIDETGRLAAEAPRLPPLGSIAAESLIDGEDGLIPAGAVPPLVLRDDRTAADVPTRRFAGALAGAVAAIASDAGLAAPREFKRLPPRGELGLLAAVVMLAVLAGMAAGFKRAVVFFSLAAAIMAAQWIAAGMGAVWLPGMAAMAALLMAGLIGPGRPRIIAAAESPTTPDRSVAPTPEPAEPEPPAAPEPEPKPALPPAGKPNSKPAAKKHAAGKQHRKRPPSRKS